MTVDGEEPGAAAGVDGTDGTLPPIVAVGASAGGLAVLRELFAALPGHTGVAFALVQHLDPAHQSHCAEILERETAIPVSEARDGESVRADHLYVAPAGATLTLRGARLRVTYPTGAPARPAHPIDALFESVAQGCGTDAVAVVLSGAGSDGAQGIRVIKSHGGLVLVQAPATAQFDSMPRSALATGLVDAALPVGELAATIIRYANGIRSEVLREQSAREADWDADTREILTLLRIGDGTDFDAYKHSTVTRRILRRVALCGRQGMRDYADLLRSDPQELHWLRRDLLIRVTEFFREPEAFQRLDETVIRRLVDRCGSSEPIRIWVPACATGEEAYSITMLVLAQLDRAHKSCPVQIFATDIDAQSIAVARAGMYPESALGTLPAGFRDRFFTPEDGHRFRARTALREVITFAVQNLLGDPPFSRLDLISCRNLLIYLKPSIQDKLLRVFHFALERDGLLFLGSADNPGQERLFESIGPPGRIFTRVTKERPVSIQVPVSVAPPPAADRAPRRRQNLAAGHRIGDLARRYLLDTYAPAAVLVNRDREALYFHGATDEFLIDPEGEPTRDVVNRARTGLRATLRLLIRQAFDRGHRVSTSEARVRHRGHYVPVSLTTALLKGATAFDDLAMICFERRQGVATVSTQEPRAEEDELVDRLEADLNAVREELRGEIEEQASAREELQSANEEILSVNEELQSANEELETSKEELQSLNEELTTANSELQAKVAALQTANNDLDNLFVSTDIALMFVDKDMVVRRFTPTASRLFNVIDSDQGRPLAHVARRFDDPDFLEDAAKVMARMSASETEVVADDGRWYLRRIAPYLTRDERVEGLTFAFVDITSRRRAEEETLRLAAVVRNASDAIIVQEPDGTIVSWNSGAARIFGFSEDEALGMNARRLVPEELAAQFEAVVERVGRGEELREIAMARITRDGRRISTELSASPIRDRNGNVTAVSTLERDVTARKHDEDAREREEQAMLMMLESTPDATIVADASGRLRHVNAHTLRLFGYSRKELLAMDVEELMPARYRAGHGAERQRYARNPVPRPMGTPLQIYACNKAGTEFPVEVSLSPVRLPTGTLHSASIRDVSERAAMDEVLGEAWRAAEKANASKTRFLAAASHDLRQPLQSLGMYLSVLEATGSGTEATAVMEKMRYSLGAVRGLLDALLDISKLDAGAVAPIRRDFCIGDLLNVIQADVEPHAREKGLAFRLVNSSCIVHSDEHLLDTIIQNIAFNAIRYTHAGRVLIGCRRKGDCLRIQVWDTGIGIPAEQIGNIFEEFVQLENPERSRDKGLGLGLAIVDRLAKLLGHAISVRSVPGKGTVFSLDVPRARTRPGVEPVPALESADTGPGVGAKGVVLLVDDDPAILEATCMLLRVVGYTVATAGDATRALELITEQGLRPDILVSDYRLPDGDQGTTLVTAIREILGQPLPAIILTGDTSTALSRVAGEVDAQVLYKPIGAAELVDVIVKTLGPRPPAV